MIKYLFIVFAVFFLRSTHAQQGLFKPFTLLIMQPDTAIILPAYDQQKDSMVATYIQGYVQRLDVYEKLVHCAGCPATDIPSKEMEEELRNLHANAPQINSFRYYQVLSAQSVAAYNYFFNEYPPYSTVKEIPTQSRDLTTLKHLADSAHAGYILYYSDIRTITTHEGDVLKMTTSLYSRKKNKIITTVTTEGDSRSRGDMWTCDPENYLSCLFTNALRTSSQAVMPVLYQLQKNK